MLLCYFIIYSKYRMDVKDSFWNMCQVPTWTAKDTYWNEISFSGSTDGLLRFWENEEGKSSHIFLLSWTSCLFIFLLWAFLCLDLLRCNFSNLSSVIWLASEDIISITKELSIHGPITSLCLGSNALFVHKIPISCFTIFKEHMYCNGCNLWLYYTYRALPANNHNCKSYHNAKHTPTVRSHNFYLHLKKMLQTRIRGLNVSPITLNPP